MDRHLSTVPDQESVEEETRDAPPKPSDEQKARPRTVHPLPSDRIGYNKQQEILRAFAVAAAENNGTASNENVGKLVHMAHSSVGLVTPFFVGSGFLGRADRGRLRPTQEVIEYSRAYQWTPDRAGHHLAPIAARSWWGQIITPRVAITPRDMDDVLAALSSAAQATPEHRQQLVTLIEFAVLTGLVQRQGNMLAPGRLDTGPAQQPTPVAEQDGPGPSAATAEVGATRPGVNTGYVQDPTEGYFEFHVNVKVRTAEFATWRPERISAFWGGVAQVLAAKGRMEEDSSG